MYIDQMTKADMITFLKFMGFNTEAPAKVFKIKDAELEYEPNQTLLVVACQISKKPYVFIFSDHGLVNIYKNADTKTPLVDINSEYGSFEQAPTCINITKQFLGYMTSRFQHEYLNSEIARRTNILKSLMLNQKRTIKEKNKTEKNFSTLVQKLDPIHEDETHFKEYFDIDLLYMKNQCTICGQEDFLQELQNHINYHENILDYLESDLKTILLDTYLQVKNTHPNSTLLETLGDKKNTPPESFGS